MLNCQINDSPAKTYEAFKFKLKKSDKNQPQIVFIEDYTDILDDL